MQMNHESRVDTLLTLLGSGLALVVLFTLCSLAPEALLAITH